MPDVVLHNTVGEKAVNLLSSEIKELIIPEVFRLGVLGPDPYILYRFFMPRFRNGINRRSGVMHRTKTGEFLMELARNSQSKEAFSYLSGFLCHYALDSTAHPLVYDLQGDKGYMHMAIEHKLDVIELNKQGKQLRDIIKYFPKYTDLPVAKKAMKKVYGWDDDYYKIGYRHTRILFWIIKDQHGILNFLLGWKRWKFAALSFRTKLCDNMDLSGFEAIETEAIELAARLITAAYEYRSGNIDENALRDIIGNRSYAGGQAEE